MIFPSETKISRGSARFIWEYVFRVVHCDAQQAAGAEADSEQMLTAEADVEEARSWRLMLGGRRNGTRLSAATGSGGGGQMQQPMIGRRAVAQLARERQCVLRQHQRDRSAPKISSSAAFYISPRNYSSVHNRLDFEVGLTLSLLSHWGTLVTSHYSIVDTSSL